MQTHYDAVVVGSGFGGAVTACRLAQAGQRVLIVERGRRYAGKEFPLDARNLRHLLWQVQGGLFDVRTLGGMAVVQGAAYGGGSQIYANVHLRPPPDLFASGWPRGLDRGSLDPYYDLVAYMLDVKPITSARRVPTKTLWMKQVAKELGRESDFFYPNLAVHFGDGELPNRFGVKQKGCTMCGRCDVGCPDAAKNTLDLNYLAVAEQKGADVATACEVFRVEPVSGGGYEVAFRQRDADGSEGTVTARSVFLCGGALNTTELLLRCRDQHGTLPLLSRQLGEGYSGNGDYLSFGVDTRFSLDPGGGPTITTALRYDRTAQKGSWFLLQEGGYPHLGLVLQAARAYHELVPMLGLEECVDVVSKLVFDQRHTTVLLAMGRDRADGRISLTPDGREVSIDWNVEQNLPLYEDEERLSADVVGKLGGKLVQNPLWQFLKRPVSVHNLGGCRMATSPEHGVVDPYGQVFHYPGLYVMDGSVLPSATGVNPASTIAAVAERNVEHYINTQLGLAGWRAPERAAAVPILDPLAALPPPTTRPPDTLTVGVRFTETMTGFYVPGLATSETFDRREYEAAEQRGKRDNHKLEFSLTITMPNLRETHAPILHSGMARGQVIAAGLTSSKGAEVKDGAFQLFVTPDSSRPRSDPRVERHMLYALPFYGNDERPYLLEGMKVIRDDPDRALDVWTTTTTLYTRLREGHTTTGKVVGTGIIRIPLTYFMRQLTTMRVIGTAGVPVKVQSALSFGNLFLGGLWDVFVQPKLRFVTREA